MLHTFYYYFETVRLKITLIFYQLFPRCCRRRLVIVVVVSVSFSFFTSRIRRLVVEVVVVIIAVSLLSAAVLLISDASVGFCASSSLSSSLDLLL